MTFAMMKFILEQMESRGITDAADTEAYPTEDGYIVTAIQYNENGFLQVVCKLVDGEITIQELKGV